MNFKLALGFTVALVAAFCVIVNLLLADTAIYEAYHRPLGIAVGAQGFVLFLIGVWRRRRLAPPPPPSRGESDEGGAEPEGSMLNLRYVGLVTSLLGLATVFILPHEGRQVIRAAEPPSARPAATNPEPDKVVKFPDLRVQGVFYRPDRPSALINSRTYFVGDWVDHQARVAAISRDSVTVELSGERKIYHFER